ncbi:cytochrome c peroxidase [Roseovarius azorensis]|uniref:Cytochrome c peroxidase n=1 Tax=Roseovarius azorensis TaxID=1287727 RepID=A0A1H7N795_9RHOB|nr:cytochrome c peroxidase [Roseovarius azorensis]SEL19350.1 cytochrome c peroxidase [Roseovarius azorensis]
MTRTTRPSRIATLVAGISALALTVAAPLAPAQEAAPLAPLPEPGEINQARADLGRMLFFDSRLSGDTGHSCASCHDPEKGWGTGEPMSHAYGDLLYFRNAPGLFNVANRNFLMWDGRLDGSDLGTLVRDMLTEAHTMNMDSRLAQERLKQVPEYMEMFEAAYGAEPYGGRIYGAIGEYLKTIRTQNAPFDAYLKGDDAAISDAAKRGLALFEGKAGCISCHSGEMLSDGGLHAIGAPDHPALLGDAPGQAAEHAGHTAAAPDDATAARQITMLRHFATMGTPNYMNLREDVGHYVVTKDEADIGKFVTPSLWDVGHTAPYMHSGVFGTLSDVVAFYNAGNERIAPLGLSPEEVADLVAFLDSLTGDAPDVTPPELPDYALRDVGKN